MRANTKYQIAEYIEAIEDYSKAIEVNSQYTYAYNNRGVTKEILKDYMGAIADYNKAIELDPKCTTAYNNLIALYGALNNPEKAEEIRKLKQKIVPKITNYLIFLCCVLTPRGFSCYKKIGVRLIANPCFYRHPTLLLARRCYISLFGYLCGLLPDSQP